MLDEQKPKQQTSSHPSNPSSNTHPNDINEEDLSPVSAAGGGVDNIDEKRNGGLFHGFVGHTLQPSTSSQYDGTQIAAFGAGGYRMHRRPLSGAAGGRDRYHHRSSFFQRQGSATIKTSKNAVSTNSNSNTNSNSTASSSWVHNTNNRQLPRGGRVPSHRQQYGTRNRETQQSESIGGIGRDFQLPFLLHSNSLHQPNSGTSPVRVQTALPTVGDRDASNDTNSMMSGFIYPAQLPSLRPSDMNLAAGTTRSLLTSKNVSSNVTQHNNANQQLQQQRWGTKTTKTNPTRRLHR